MCKGVGLKIPYDTVSYTMPLAELRSAIKDYACFPALNACSTSAFSSMHIISMTTMVMLQRTS